MARMQHVLVLAVVVCLLAGCEDAKKWRQKQTQIARGEYKEPGLPPQQAPASQPLFRHREFNAIESGQEQDGPRIRADVMLVNDQTVRTCDVLEPVWTKLEDLSRTAKPGEYAERAQVEVRHRLQETISEFLVWYEVKRKITSEMEEPLKKAIESRVRERINKDFEGSQARFERYLSQRGQSLEDYKEQEKRRVTTVQYLREEILPQIRISRRQLLEYYRQRRKDYESPARVRLQIIDLPDRRFAGEDDIEDAMVRIRAHDAAARQAEQAMAELKAGADFAEVARKYSRGLHAEEGGRWGWINEDPGLQGRWEPVSRVAFGLKAGCFSDILETADGYFIVRAEEKVEAVRREFEQVQPELERQLRDRMFDTLSRDYILKLWVKGDIQGLTAFSGRLLTLIPKAAPPKEARAVDATLRLDAGDDGRATSRPAGD